MQLLLAAAPVALGASTITVGVAHPGVPVSSHLYGIFLEEINHAVSQCLFGTDHFPACHSWAFRTLLEAVLHPVTG